MAASPALSTYREGSLHASAKEIYAREGGVTEESVGGYVVDVVRDDELIEIQTGSFASAARKLRRLVADHRIALVHPIAVERWLLRVDADGAVLAHRRSPKRGQPLDIFEELVAFPELVAHPNFRIELLMIREEEIRGPVPAGTHYRYPREWRRIDRRLLEVVEAIRIDTPADLLALLPEGLPSPFTTADIAVASRRSKRLSMRAAYCLSKAGATRSVGRAGRLIAYEAATPDGPVDGTADRPGDAQ
jgi:hypothetical protein